MTNRRTALQWALAGLLAGAAAVPVQADDAPSLESQVKAAFLLKLALFVDWPPAAFSSPREPFRIGILGTDPFGAFFDAAVATEKINGRPVQLIRGQAAASLKNCHIVFVAETDAARADAAVTALDSLPVLTVADQPGFAHRGGMVNFTKESGKVRFEVNMAAAARCQLRLSAKFLQVVRVVQPASKGGKS